MSNEWDLSSRYFVIEVRTDSRMFYVIFDNKIQNSIKTADGTEWKFEVYEEAVIQRSKLEEAK